MFRLARRRVVLRRLDPRTKLALGLMAIGAVFVAKEPTTLIGVCVILLITLLLLGLEKTWLRSSRVFWPMLGVVFAIALLSFDLWVALTLSIRLLALLSVSLVFFRTVNPVEMGDALRKMGVPYELTFILTTAMRYVPLIGQKTLHIIDAQRSRGIDLRPKIRNVKNYVALLMPLLVHSFLLSDELAMAMESRGFGRKDRSSRRDYHLAVWEYGLMATGLILLAAFAWWERG
ncbi:MAG: energy-coupling factor transporter transmembrane protein EcfT [Deltaproteobacteria bacterium]|nr:MAG: energy-coupling factor transporter transmembrane protein EcfT [Deltaproteobacteria bacterium]